MKVREVIRRLEEEGWFLARCKGSHRQYKHTSKVGLVTISGHMNDEVPPGTLSCIKKQAGWEQI